MGTRAGTEIREILDHYEIGDLSSFSPLDRGYVNVSYTIETVAKRPSVDLPTPKRTRYFFRKYKAGITEEEIKFEHSVINHLIEQGFDLVAALIPTADGSTYVKRDAPGAAADGPPTFYAIFEFLPGEDRYTWDNPACTAADLQSAAAVFGQFHTAVHGLQPEGRRTEPSIRAFLPMMAQRVEQHLSTGGDTPFDTYLAEHGNEVEDEIERTLQAIRDRGCGEMTQIVIHCDYHPGNLKFRDSEVTGLFDFDWSKIDARSFDVGLALVYFCTAWEPKRNGEFELPAASLFLRAYQSACAAPLGVGPLDDAELACLPHMIAAGNLYVLNWALEDFYAKAVDVPEYLRYLHHHIGLIDWLRDKGNWSRLKNLKAAVAWTDTTPSKGGRTRPSTNQRRDR